MSTFKRDALEQFKLVFWVVFVLWLFLAALALLFGREAGYAATAWICLGFALLVTMVFGGAFALNLLVVWIILALRRFRRSKVAP